jgi:hypothetical protein
MAHPRSFTFLASLVSLIALAVACKSQFEADDGKYCQETGNCSSGRGGAGTGGGGNGDGGSAGDMGSGGSGGSVEGSGGGGSGGGPAECTSDDICVEKAKLATGSDVQGVFCVAGACTKPAGMCLVAERVVIDSSRRAPVVTGKTFADACYFDSLEGALANPQAAMHVVVVADAAALNAPLNLELNNVTLDGQASQAGQPVALSVTPADGLPLVRLAGDDIRLKGFALDGANATPDVVAAGVTVAAGSTTLEGPFRLQRLPLALSVEEGAGVTVAGKADAAVLFTDNDRGVVVKATARLTMTGEGSADSLVVEGTRNGAAVFFDVGAGALACSTLKNVTLRDNVISNGDNGTGALEVRRGRQLVVDGCTFVHNRQSVTLSGSGSSSANDFLGVHLENNVFTDALPLGAGTGSVLCGDNLGSQGTALNLRDGNVFRSQPTGSCGDLPAASEFDCNAGKIFAHSAPSKSLSRQCLVGTLQCGGF